MAGNVKDDVIRFDEDDSTSNYDDSDYHFFPSFKPVSSIGQKIEEGVTFKVKVFIEYQVKCFNFVER